MAKKKPAAHAQPDRAASPIRDRIKDFRRVKASDIHGAPWNWREHPPAQKEALAGSIAELGFFDPVDVRERADGSLELIDGHARRDLIHERIGPDTLIPVIVTDFSEAEAKKANLLKDPIAGLAEANQQALAALVGQVELKNDALQQLAAGMVTVDGPVQLKPVAVQAPPKMTWILIGIPTVQFGTIAAEVEKIAAHPEVVVETTSNNGPDEEI